MALLVGLPILAAETDSQAIDLVDSFYRSGSLVFGRRHVVLPLLQAEVVPPGWVSNDQFLAGYGAAQAVPGPLFTFAAYLGAVIGGWWAAILCLVAVFVPSFLPSSVLCRSGKTSAQDLGAIKPAGCECSRRGPPPCSPL